MSPEAKRSHLTILGGGPAGLAVGYYARKAGLPFTIYEARNRLGGNCVTLEHQGFRFDSGAHRFHDTNQEIAQEMLSLMGADLQKVHVPSQIFHDDRLIDFPLSPANLLKHLGAATFLKASAEVLVNRVSNARQPRNFADHAIAKYGHTIASMFLLNYSSRLWGKPCDQLSLSIAGRRLKGLHLSSYLAEALLGERTKVRHLEGASFYYPTHGIGMITDGLASVCGAENIQKTAKVSRIIHSEGRIRAIELNGRTEIPVDEVISSLPITSLVEIMRPSPPERVVDLAGKLEFRSMVLVAVFIDRLSVTQAATVYFPDDGYPFTRLYEPRNRSGLMSPDGKTSLVAEIPCQQVDGHWTMPDEELSDLVIQKLVDMAWVHRDEIMGTRVVRMDHAYPVLVTGCDAVVGEITEYLSQFANLHITGRNGKFVYSWIHDMMEYGQEIVSTISGPD